ncbi:hypothetical protein A5790_02890 [Mycobacterium sp. 852002-51152_SCH6134967]|uniref:DUF6416 domain-containing protein n=1 Tax=Mycobacterium sp. 852002-51152_SCH6134967 TaxID=1834096 RepID=UPI000800F344|nr:DUF6416 domain-containing protein [Mycobacterium sp. 852002-51152_SCH6134967]OBF98566.1 hypothetical protein A5790_02890 [Mycobacterium sp. 852002-51152_SCH6134967]
MMDVTVKVPEERLVEFYAMHAAWLSAPPNAAVSSRGDQLFAIPQPVSHAGEDANGRLPWSADRDAALAAKLWDKFSDPAKALFSTLMDEPDRQFNGEELAGMLNIPNGHSGVAGVLAWPGKYCKKENRELLWKWAYPVEGEPVVYWITPEVAAILREARSSQAD